MRHNKKLATNKESTFFALFSQNMVEMITTWGDDFHQVSWGEDKKYGFFTNGQILNVSHFLFDSDFRFNLNGSALFWDCIFNGHWTCPHAFNSTCNSVIQFNNKVISIW